MCYFDIFLRYINCQISSNQIQSTMNNLMTIEQYFEESIMQNELSEKSKASLEKWDPVSSAADVSENDSSGDFECNICLDGVQDPVVTLCGHLFCLPCIYKWIHLQSSQPQCPVCKSEISQKTLVPLYGRGEGTKLSEGKFKKNHGMNVPQRPTYNPLHLSQTNCPRSVLGFGDVATTEAVHSGVGMIGEMVYARIFGSTEMYNYPNSYHIVGSSSPRQRRHLMLAEESLGRICFFLFCCMVLCLLLF